jgi:hypothetical protein
MISDAKASVMLLFVIKCLSEAADAADGSPDAINRVHDILDKCRREVGKFPLLTPIYDAILCRNTINQAAKQTTDRKSEGVAQVYFMRRDDGLIKIGYSHYPDVRLSQLQQQNRCKIVLLAKVTGARKKESELHKKFAIDRIEGEWFKESPELMQEIMSHKQ